MKISLFAYCLLFGLVTYVHAQQPSYYRIGEKECTGIDLYSITQDQQGHIWLSSNQGLLRYDGYTFHQYFSDEMKSSSLFGLKKDRNGTIYCNNLVGQFFRIVGDSLQLFAETPDSLLAEFIEFDFDNRNQLVFRTQNYYQINEQGDIHLLLEDEESGVKNIPRTDQDELVLVDAAENKLFYYKNSAFRIVQQSGFNALPAETRLFFKLKINQNRLLLHGQRTPMICEMQDGQCQPLALEYFNAQQAGWNTYMLADGRIWLVSERNGSRVFDRHGKTDYQGVTLLPNYRISCFWEDEEGNLWLPTLGKGIIVIPNQTFIDYRNHPLLKEDDIKSVTVDKRGKVYLGGISGTLYQVDGDRISVLLKGVEKNGLLHYIESEDALIFGSNKLDLRGKEPNKVLSLFAKSKDVIAVGPNQYFKAMYGGVEFQDSHTGFSSPLAQYLKTFNSRYQLAETCTFNVGRTYILAWEATRRYIWAGTNRGLKVIKPDTTVLMLHHGQPIKATSLVYENEKIWVSTKKNGVLVYQQDSLVLQLSKEDGLLSNDIQKIILKDHFLYLISKAGLQMYDLRNHTFNNITQSDGLLSEFILDFAITDQTAWLIFHSGVQKIPLNYSKSKETELKLNMHQVTINGKAVPLNEVGQFNYDQNEVAFELMAKGYQHRGKLTYQYQLQGWKNEWGENTYRNNTIEYKSLPPGNYQFMARAVGQNQSVSPLLTYAFTIKAPFWQQAWFYVACILAIVLIMLAIFKFREHIITQRLQLESQLKMSEVTALKAQMNPHFIFNTLNSIQDLILMDDIRASNRYLGKFADLMRMLLNASGENQIPVAREINLLELYLEMETLRFGDEFTANVHSELSSSQLEAIKIPPLLIQPYVENAIKHGLLHKKGRKVLNVHFFLEDQALQCTITDNGVGRKKSAQIKARRQQKHLSFATIANQKRIDLVNEVSKRKINISIQDLATEQGAAGTVVHLTFHLS